MFVEEKCIGEVVKPKYLLSYQCFFDFLGCLLILHVASLL